MNNEFMEKEKQLLAKAAQDVLDEQARKKQALQSQEEQRVQYERLTDLPAIRVWIALRALPLSDGKEIAERFLIMMVAPSPHLTLTLTSL